MRAALSLLEKRSFGAISLREVTREAGVTPAAFYGHFDDMEALGLALIEESFETLRAMLREARAELANFDQVIRDSVEILVRHIHEHRLEYQFIARERYGGVAALRHAIRTEIRLFSSDLALDLSRFPVLNEWTSEDLGTYAGLMVTNMISIVEAVLDAPPGDAEADAAIKRDAERQLLMLVLGSTGWRSNRGQAP
jgi:AcrR family transcriptional regulator